MELSMTVLSQVLVMFLLIGVGAFCFKIKMIGRMTSKQLTDLLLYVVNPLVVINAYNMPFELKLAKNLGLAFALGVASHLIAMAVAYVFIRTKGNEKRAPLERFSIIYTNCGFMALPLVSALFGTEGVLYASAYMTVFNLLSWTHGYVSLHGKGSKQIIWKVFLSPVIIAVFVGLILFFSPIKLPTILGDCVRHMASINTPLAMIITGVTLMQGNIFAAFKQLRYYYIVMLGNVVVPLIATALYLFLPVDKTVIMVNLVATACPCAVTTLLFATKLKKDIVHASNILMLSNISCAITIPLTIALYQLLS